MAEQDVTNAIILEKLKQMDARLGDIRSEQRGIKNDVSEIKQGHAVHQAESEAMRVQIAENQEEIKILNAWVKGIAGYDALISAVAVLLGLKQ